MRLIAERILTTIAPAEEPFEAGGVAAEGVAAISAFTSASVKRCSRLTAFTCSRSHSTFTSLFAAAPTRV